MRASTSARRPSSRSSSCESPMPWRRSGTHCSCPPPTRRSSERSWVSKSTNAAKRRSPRPRWGSPGDAGSCGCTTLPARSGSAMSCARSSGRREPAGPTVTAVTKSAGTGDVRTYLVRGDDPSLVAQEARVLIDRLVGDRESSFLVEEHGASGEDLDVKAVIDACLTPSFLGDRRVVVVRDAGRIGAAEAAALGAAVADPLPTTVLVLVGGAGTVPQALVKAVTANGELIDASAGTGRVRTSWVADHLKDAPLRFDAGARARVPAHLGEDLGRLAALIETLVAAYGEGATISIDELEPFLGSAGAVPPWDLTDAIDSGSIAGAL